jgi:hypothetical protein
MCPMLPFAGSEDTYDSMTHEIKQGIVGSCGAWSV